MGATKLGSFWVLVACLLAILGSGCQKEAAQSTKLAAVQASKEYEAAFQQGLAHLKNREYSVAAAGFTKLVPGASRSSQAVEAVKKDVRYQRGIAYLGMGFPDIALNDFDAVLEDWPEAANVYLERARAFQRLGNTQRAIEDATQAIRLVATNPDAYRIRGEAYLISRDYQLAIDNLEQSKSQGGNTQEIDPLLAKAYRQRIERLTAAGETAAAQEMIRKLQRIDAASVPPEELSARPDIQAKSKQEAAAHLKLGEELAKQGDREDAHKEFSKAITSDPNSALAYEKRAENWMARGFADNAVMDMRIAYRVGGYTPERYRLLAQALLDAGYIYDAADMASQMMHLGSVDATAFGIRGTAYFRRGMFKEAVRDLAYAVEKDAQLYVELTPLLAEAHFRYGKTLEREGRVNDAQSEIKLAKELGWTDESSSPTTVAKPTL
jgi:tetratricopeptide (TPR) repeat protein